MLLLDMAYRLLREFRQAFTRLDTPPFSNRRHPGSDIARESDHTPRLSSFKTRLEIPKGIAVSMDRQFWQQGDISGRNVSRGASHRLLRNRPT